MELEYTFFTISTAIIKLFILMAAGYSVYRLKFINAEFLDTLSMLLVRLIFPALIISKTITNFNFYMFPRWWIFPVAALVFSFAGLLIGWVSFKCIGGGPSGGEFAASCAFQNCGYLPMNIILFAFAGSMADRMLIYMFLFILGFNILMWSLVPLFLKGVLHKGFSPKVFLNPPVVATAVALLWVFFFGQDTVPYIFMAPLSQLGQAAFPVAMLTLGAYLARYQAYLPEGKTRIFSASLVKMLLFPALVLVCLFFVPFSRDVSFFLFLQACMPTAVSLVVIGSYTGADNRFLSSVIFYTHIMAIFCVPLWIAVFNRVVK